MATAANRSRAFTTLDCPCKACSRDGPHSLRLPQTAPSTHETGPTGPGLTCAYSGGRCCV